LLAENPFDSYDKTPTGKVGWGGVAVSHRCHLHFQSTSSIICNYHSGWKQTTAAAKQTADCQGESKSKSKSTFWPANYFHLVAKLVSVGSGQDYVAFVFRPAEIASDCLDRRDGCVRFICLLS